MNFALIQIKAVVHVCKLTGGQRGHCSAGSGGKTLPPRGHRIQKIAQGCDEAPRSPETQYQGFNTLLGV